MIFIPSKIEPQENTKCEIVFKFIDEYLINFSLFSFSYDVRGSKPDVGSHWKDAEVLGERGYFRTISEPSTLSLDSVEERDQGEYRCRVDFRMSPTRNSKVHLSVIGKYNLYKLSKLKI